MNTNPETLLEDIRSGRLVLTCGLHNYVAAQKRGNATRIVPPVPNGCKQCWKVYFISDHVFTAPNKRQENLEELDGVIHRAIEYEEKGQFGADFELYDTKDPRFEVQIEKGIELTDDDGKRPCKQCGKVVDFSDPHCVHETQEESAWRNM